MKYKLKDLYEVSNGLSKARTFFGSGFPFISFSTVFNNFFVPEEINDFVQSTPKEQLTYSIKKGDILITRTSETIDELGMSCVALKDYPTATFNGFCKRLRPLTDKVYPSFIGYYLRTPYFRSNFMKVASLITRASLRNDDLLRFNVELPPIDKQKKIADILFKYDTLIKSNNKRINLLEQMAENLYKEWFIRFRFPGYEDVEFENGIPKEWKIGRLKDYGRVETGKTPSTEVTDNYGEDYLFIKTPDMRGNIWVIDTVEKLSEKGHSLQKKKKLPKGSIMVSCIGTGGVVAINSKEGHTNQQINSIIIDDSNNREWLYMVCVGLKTTIEMFGATGSTMTNLSKGKFENLKIIEPSYEMRKNYHELTYNIFIEIEKLMYANDNLIKQRDMLLPRLMSGELEV